MTTKTDLTKEERIKKEQRRLTRIFKNMPIGRKDTVQSLIANAAFMAVTLEDLQETITRDGVISEYQNGENQWGTKKSPEVDVHIAMTKNHIAVIKQLCDLLPTEDGTKAGDELMEFVKRGRR
jgi:hypothetical protein